MTKTQKKDELTGGQLQALSYVALLSPLIRLVPASVVKLAGSASWLSCLLAFLPLMALALFVLRMQRGLPSGQGMCEVFLRSMGMVFGRGLLGLYGLWLLMYAGFLLLSGAERFSSTVYPNSGAGVFVGVMLALTTFAATGQIRMLGRSAAIFWPLLLALPVVVFGFALVNVEPKNLLPLTESDALPMLYGMLPVVNVVSILSYISFASCYVRPGELRGSSFAVLNGIIVVIAMLLCVCTVGLFGAELVARQDYPLFSMIRCVHVFSVLQRIEAFVIALWVLSDFVLITLLFRIAQLCLRSFAGLPPMREELRDTKAPPLKSLFHRGSLIVWLCSAITLASAILLYPYSIGPESMSRRVIPLINLIFVFGGFPLVFIVGKFRKKL